MSIFSTFNKNIKTIPLINKLRKIFFYIQALWVKRSSSSYCKWLKNKGIKIGEGTHIYSQNALIDISRPSLVTIGSNCFINQHFTLLTHDFVTGVFLNSGRQFVNSSGRVTIGNNIRFGHHVMVLKGVTIGDNCFIGAGSIVSKDIPANSVAVGMPCRVIMSIEEYYQKRLRCSEEEALDYAKSIYERFHRKPKIEEMREEFIWFVSGNEVEQYPMLPIRRQLGKMYDTYVATHRAKYRNFSAFLSAAGIK